MNADHDETKSRFRLRDFAEIAIGGSIMAFPVAATEEIWSLSTELSLTRVLLFSAASLLVMAAFIYALHGHGSNPDRKVFVQRVVSTYGATLVIAALLLYGLDRIDLVHEPLTGLKRTILVAFPASYAATVVDSFGGSR